MTKMKLVSDSAKKHHSIKLADRLVLELEDLIATGEIEPGTKLEEEYLAKRFGVSRTPIRETLQKLAASGLIILRPRRGAVVASLSLEYLLQIFECMAEIEAACGRLAAKRMTKEEHEALLEQHRICGEVSKTGDTTEYYKENGVFHLLIYRGSHNGFLEEEALRLRRRLQVYRRLQLNFKGRIEDSYAEHEAITRAIIDGNEDLAASLLRAHVCIQGDRFTQWVNSKKTAQHHKNSA